MAQTGSAKATSKPQHQHDDKTGTTTKPDSDHHDPDVGSEEEDDYLADDNNSRSSSMDSMDKEEGDESVGSDGDDYKDDADDDTDTGDSFNWPKISHHHHVHVHKKKDSPATTTTATPTTTTTYKPSKVANGEDESENGSKSGSRTSLDDNLDTFTKEALDTTSAPVESNGSRSDDSSTTTTTTHSPTTLSATTSSPDVGSIHITSGKPAGSTMAPEKHDNDEEPDDEQDSTDDYSEEGEYRTTISPACLNQTNKSTPGQLVVEKPAQVTTMGPKMNQTVFATTKTPTKVNYQITIKPLTTTMKPAKFLNTTTASGGGGTNGSGTVGVGGGGGGGEANSDIDPPLMK